jgi:putative drug exporter of the RND superfamily
VNGCSFRQIQTTWSVDVASLFSTERLARFSTRRPWTVVGAWVVLLIAAGLAATGVGSVLTTDQKVYAETDSLKADNLLSEKMAGEPEREYIVVQSQTRTIDDPAFKAEVGNIVTQVRALTAQTANVTSVYDGGTTGLVSADGRTALVPVVLKGEAAESVKPILKIVNAADGKDGFTVVTGGKGSISNAFSETSQSDLESAEVFGLPIALVVLVLVFGALVAAGLPLILGLLAIVVAVGVTAVVGQAVELSVFAVNVITTMGLAVGIDYSLIIVQRFREERRKGLDRDAAIIRAGATANRAVLFSGMTVIVALSGLLLVPDSIFRSLAIGAIFVVVAAIAAALTLLPAVLRLLGDRVNTLALRVPWRRRDRATREPGAFWARTTAFVTKHAVLSVVVSVGLLLAAAAPYAGIKIGNSGVGVLPADTSAPRAFAILDEEFNAGLLAPADIVVSAPNVNNATVGKAIANLEARFATDPVFGAATVQVNAAHDLALVSVPIKGDSQSEVAHQAVARLRREYIPAAFSGSGAEVYVTGNTAKTDDYKSIIDRYTPIVFAFVLGLSFVILLLVFRSIVVPIKAVIMNMLSVGAAYGLMVLVFQHGVGNGVFGFRQVDRIEAWVPLFMFAITFGLSMDYHVFVLSRIREHFDQTGDNSAAVAFGVRTTAGMITGAALIMVAVFGGMASGQLAMFQQMGFGLAVAVAIDATIVRTVLVPASMTLLGKWNWYLPSWLGWLPEVDIEGARSGKRLAGSGA